jgi:hypothetical protein
MLHVSAHSSILRTDRSKRHPEQASVPLLVVELKVRATVQLAVAPHLLYQALESEVLDQLWAQRLRVPLTPANISSLLVSFFFLDGDYLFAGNSIVQPHSS